jgi:hypothetical protein
MKKNTREILTETLLHLQVLKSHLKETLKERLNKKLAIKLPIISKLG